MSELLEIAIIEDNQADSELCIMSLKEANIKNNVVAFEKAEEALNYLNNGHNVGLILLDINLPGMSGFDFLSEFKNNKKLIPVVILTSSAYEKDILEGYKIGANAFLTKPIKFEDFKKIISATADFWFNIVAVPEGGYALQ